MRSLFVFVTLISLTLVGCDSNCVCASDSSPAPGVSAPSSEAAVDASSESSTVVDALVCEADGASKDAGSDAPKEVSHD